VLWVSVADGPTSAICGFAVATFGVEMTISPSWSFCLDVGGRNAGTISAAMNMAGNLGGFASTNAFPLLRGLTGSVLTYFHAAAILNGLALLCWCLMPVVPSSRRPAFTAKEGTSARPVRQG
jgi:ACS family glucarate transporter-like MFS transporter